MNNAEFVALHNPRDPRSWARRIMARVDGGEPVPIYVEECAREALGLEPLAKREPGSDDV